MKTGVVPQTRYPINPANIEISTFCSKRHLKRITSAIAGTSSRAIGAVVVDNSSVVSQLAKVISLQNKGVIELNNLCHKKIERKIKRKEKKKDRTKKLHPAIMNMIKRASTTDHTDKNEEITLTFLRFINPDNLGLVQNELIHQFKEGGFLDVTFALGMTQALYLGDFF